ncbi:hypothetical protein LDENG_00096520 [Lucifuga dentata]|nr:hypothetical protein LDENG_00096520 [Lucifuga dentata]
MLVLMWESGRKRKIVSSLSQPHSLESLKMWRKKVLYIPYLHMRNLQSLQDIKASKWAEFFGPGSSLKGCWRSLYKRPVEKQAADLQWRMVQGAIPMNRHKAPGP